MIGSEQDYPKNGQLRVAGHNNARGNSKCVGRRFALVLVGEIDMQLTREQMLHKRPKVLVAAILVALVIFLQAPSARSFLHDTREHLWQWSVEKVVSAATRELQKRAKF